ncbi:MAG TPA: ABC transporter substrate-binding protein [Tepidisphaeraceae bacterium]|jgi:ABC-type glycerol-3-phosphate transport system substrate-binding protein
MHFPLGKPILVMLLLSAGSAGILLTRRPPPRSDLTVWVFADSHARIYRSATASDPSLIEQYQQQTGLNARVDLISQRALDMRLLSLFMSGARGEQVPDLAEVEIGSVGKFFRPPASEVGFLPLNTFLKKSGNYDRIVKSRFAPWTKNGVIFGVPEDLHPVTITFRKDLFEQAGIDLPACKTWDAFHEACLRFQNYWRTHGFPRRMAIELPRASANHLHMLLLQRHVNLLDDANRVYMTDPRVVETVVFYAQMAAGQKRIGADSSSGAGLWTRDLARGELCAFLTPDWRLDDIREYGGELQGKLAMMPLPVFAQGDARTSTWGGTMIGIPRNCRDPEKSWKLLEFLLFSPAGFQARRRTTNIIPPVMDQWADKSFDAPEALFGGQKVSRLYIDLAGEIPPQYVTPFSPVAAAHLSIVMSRAIHYLEEQGSQGLRQACDAWLAESQHTLEKQIAFGAFE